MNLIPMNPVTSGSLSAVGYDPVTYTLAVQFKSGAIYHYANVDSNTHQALMNAESKGSFFRLTIKSNAGMFPHTKVDGPAAVGTADSATNAAILKSDMRR